MYEIGNPAPVVCARKETEDLAQRMVKHLHLEWEPAKWVAIWPYGGERLTYILR
jgi:hypothetical protein